MAKTEEYLKNTDCPDCHAEGGICQVCWNIEKDPDMFVLHDEEYQRAVKDQEYIREEYAKSIPKPMIALPIYLRAYCPEHNEMYYMGDDRNYRFEVYEDSIWYIPNNQNEDYTFSTYNTCPHYETKLIIVTQFIGLFAKGNKKIFEGDRLKCKRGYFYTVIFRGGEFRIKREDKETEFRKGDSKSLTLIGNIFEV